MAVTVNWSALSSLTTYLATELDALADSTTDTTGFSAVGASIGSSTATTFNRYMALSFNVGTATASRTAGGFAAACISYAADGTNYDSESDKAFSQIVATFPITATQSAYRMTKVNIPIPPLEFRMQMLNDTGQPFTATGNMLKYMTYNEVIA